MQHPDEGMIHTWLDGQLPPREAAALEAHVAECPQCAAKVAEERGYAAGATRILTALDNVPADVIPISTRPAPARFPRRFLQAAAMFLVVVTGGLIAVRVSRERIEIPSAAKTVSATDTQRVAAATAPPVAVPPETATATAQVTKQTTPPAKMQTREQTTAPGKAAVTPPRNIPVTENVPRAADARRVSPSTTTQNRSFAPSIVSGAIPSAPVVPAPSPPVQKSRGNDTTDVDIVMSRDQLQLQSVVVTGVASVEAPKLSVVRTDSIEGGRRTFLRTGSGRIAQLTETVSPVPAVVTGASTSALNGIIGARGAASSTPAIVRVRAAGTHTITWKDEATGKFYSLSGEFTERELREMKAEIEANAALRK